MDMFLIAMLILFDSIMLAFVYILNRQFRRSESSGKFYTKTTDIRLNELEMDVETLTETLYKLRKEVGNGTMGNREVKKEEKG